MHVTVSASVEVACNGGQDKAESRLSELLEHVAKVLWVSGVQTLKDSDRP